MTPNSAPRLALFAYGSLRERKVQRWLFGRAVPATPDSVHGACCRWVDDLDADLFRLTGQRGYPMLWLDANTPTCIDGERLRLSAAALQRADAYEGDAYRREVVQLRSGHRAWVYVEARRARR